MFAASQTAFSRSVHRQLPADIGSSLMMAGVPVVATVGVPSVATALSGLAAEPDPIFAAIEEHKRMNVLFGASFQAAKRRQTKRRRSESWYLGNQPETWLAPCLGLGSRVALVMPPGAAIRRSGRRHAGPIQTCVTPAPPSPLPGGPGALEFDPPDPLCLFPLFRGEVISELVGFCLLHLRSSLPSFCILCSTVKW
jgi:hypothetical protein